MRCPHVGQFELLSSSLTIHPHVKRPPENMIFRISGSVQRSQLGQYPDAISTPSRGYYIPRKTKEQGHEGGQGLESLYFFSAPFVAQGTDICAVSLGLRPLGFFSKGDSRYLIS